MLNPYESPAVPEAEPTSYKLYSAGQVAWATFLGSPVAGAILMAKNYWRIGESKSAQLAITYGVLLTLALFGASLFLPDSFPGFVLPAATTFGLFQWAKTSQGPTVTRHFIHGGRKASHWAATGVGLACLLVILVAVVLVLVVLVDFPEPDVDEFDF